ncbi:MAG: DUF2971 domain-containing protein [Pseudomonadota bacterium]
MEAATMRVYHFIPLEYAIDNLRNHRMKVSRYRDLNDPFEMLALDLSRPDVRDAANATKSEFDRRFGLICFSKNCSDPVLWSHYADKHRGAAMGFDVEDENALEIQYSRARVEPKFIDDHDGRRIDPSVGACLTSTKFINWKYEQEVRVVMDLADTYQSGGLDFFYLRKVGRLREIVLGHRSELRPSDFDTLLAPEYLGVRVWQSRLAFGTYKVVERLDVPAYEVPE